MMYLEDTDVDDDSGVYRLHPAVAVEDFGERALALHCESLRLVELNATAADLLSRLDGQATLEQVAAAMAADYGQAPAVVLADVREIVARMLDLGLVERLPGPGLAASESPFPETKP